MKKLILEQLYGWWFVLATFLTVFLFFDKVMGDNFLVYFLFDCVLTVLGHRLIANFLRSLEHSELVNDMLAKTRNERTEPVLKKEP